MAQITRSGFYHDALGQPFLVTQGLAGYTLVDYKKILFRLFLDSVTISRTTSVLVKITYIGIDNPPTWIMVPVGDLLVEYAFPNGPSIGIIFRGNVFPSASTRYKVEFSVIAGEEKIAHMEISELKFERSGRLRVLAKAIQSITRTAPWGNTIKSDITWLFELGAAMERFGAMLPISDDVVHGQNPGENDGLGYVVGENIDAWPQVCPSGNPPSIPDNQYPNFLVCPSNEMLDSNLQEAKQLNSLGIRIDITVAWRPRDPMKPPPPSGGEGVGGSAPSVNPSADRRFGSVCGGNRNGVENTAPIMAQEVAHNFGVVSPSSPYFDGGYHSKNPEIIDPFAFDFVRLKPYYPYAYGPLGAYLGDVMSYAWQQGKDQTLFNAYDWEHLRRKLVNLPLQAVQEQDKDKEESKDNAVEDIQNAFGGLQKINPHTAESTLTSKPGFEWHWTRLGFQGLIEGKARKNRSGLAPSAEAVLSALRDNSVKEVYAPVDGKSLDIVISPERNNSIGCEVGNVRSIG